LELRVYFKIVILNLFQDLTDAEMNSA